MIYEKLLRPALFCLNAETAHNLAIASCRVARVTPGAKAVLRTLFLRRKVVECMGLRFPNRVVLAAGLDKNAYAPDVFAAMGFGGVEIGTVTPRPQPGNPKPRAFRLPQDRALVNRMGFNNGGVEATAKRLARLSKRDFVLGGNIGKNTDTPNERAVDDYLFAFEHIYDVVDYIVLNVSCPNIKDLGKISSGGALDSIMGAVAQARAAKGVLKPLVLKLSHDISLDMLAENARLVERHGFDGVIVSNTSSARAGLTTSPQKVVDLGNGGLSGRPLFARNVELVRAARRELREGIAVIACGGIFTPADARAMVDAGADLVQLYTGFIYQGPASAKRIVLHM